MRVIAAAAAWIVVFMWVSPGTKCRSKLSGPIARFNSLHTHAGSTDAESWSLQTPTAVRLTPDRSLMADVSARVLDASRLALLEHHRTSRALRTMPRPLPPVSRDAINGELPRQLPGHDPRTIKVEVRTLDTWSAKHEPGPIDFIGADIHGTEGDGVAERRG